MPYFRHLLYQVFQKSIPLKLFQKVLGGATFFETPCSGRLGASTICILSLCSCMLLQAQPQYTVCVIGIIPAAATTI